MLAFPDGIQGGLRRLYRPLASRVPALRGAPHTRAPDSQLRAPASEHQEEGSI
jgi:hypothetical protein